MRGALIIWCVALGWILTGSSRAESLSGLGSGGPPRARVVLVEDARAMFAFDPDPEVVEQMVNKGIQVCTSRESVAAAWSSLVSSKDTIGLKVFSAPGGTSGTRPVVVAAVVKGLLAAGVPARQIVIWDKHLWDLRLAGFGELATRFGVQLAGSADEGYDPNVYYDNPLLGKLVWGDYEFGKKPDNAGRRSYVSKLITQRLTKIINITPLFNHNLAQVSGNLYSLAMGSVDNTIRFEAGDNAFGQLSAAVPEIYALKEVGDHVILNIVDGLICQYQGEEKMLLQYSTMLCQIRLSTDPVALDVLSVRELEKQRQRAKVPPIKPDWQMYNNAALLELGIADPRRIDIVRVPLSKE
jgi:hypothetical protein